MDDFKSKIASDITMLEEKYKVKILIAVDLGSRAYGVALPKSDYDVRFVYKNNNSGYYFDAIKCDRLETITHKDGLFDYHGWDIEKFIQLLYKNNAYAIEFLKSDIGYYYNWKFNYYHTGGGLVERDAFSENLMRILEVHVDDMKIFDHYNGLAKRELKENFNALSRKHIINCLKCLAFNELIKAGAKMVDVPLDVMVTYKPFMSNIHFQKIIKNEYDKNDEGYAASFILDKLNENSLPDVRSKIKKNDLPEDDKNSIRDTFNDFFYSILEDN